LQFVTIRHASRNPIVAIFGVPQIRESADATMQTELKRLTAEAAGRFRSPVTDERRELALLAEFMRHDSVVSLAGEIAERLGAKVRGNELIAAADLGERRCGN
jgi:hypothetical protein